MSRLPVVRSTDLIKYLIKKGFEPKPTRRTSHRVFVKYGRYTTVPVHGNNEIGKGLLKAILAQAGISMEEFKQDWND